MKRMIMTLTLALFGVAPSFGAGLMQPKEDSLPPLQIKDHKVHVVINNGFAVTEVDQIFHNPHDQDLDAIYTFPLPKDASLSELSLWIDGQEVVGEVVERERARTIHKEERDAGRETALAEKREYHAFDVFVGPVRAGSDTRVRLIYLQPVEIDTGVGRYVYPLEEGNVDGEAHAFWDRLPRVHGHFSFECDIRSSYPLDEVRIKNHEDVATVSQLGPDSWNVRVDASEGSGALDRDIVVYYLLAEDLPARVDLLAHRVGDGQGTYMVVITPGNDLQEITEGVDWSVVLDISGSMADKIAMAAEGVARAIDRMRPEDRFRVVLFAETASHLIPDWTLVTPDSVDQVRRQLKALAIRGGTNLFAGLEAGLDGLETDRTSAVILVSDGGANVGPSKHGAFLKLMEKRDVRVFTFVMGQGANRPLLERLAKDSGGFSMAVSNEDDLYGRILQARLKLAREAMHGVSLKLKGARVDAQAPERLPTVYFGQQIVVLGRYLEPEIATLSLDARISGEDRHWETRIHLPDYDDTYPELERLWAFARVQDLEQRIEDGGESEPRRKAIVELGTTYSIVTDYTSMIVVEEEKFDELGIDRSNKRRVERERQARDLRWKGHAKDTRADRNQPMYGTRRSHGLGGGAAGPGLLGMLASLLGARWYLRRRVSS